MASSDNEFSSADEDELINEVDKIDRNQETMDFSSDDEDEMIREVERIERKKFLCDLCNRSYRHRSHLTRHKLSHTFHVQCPVCLRQFRRNDVLKRHMKTIHGFNKHAFPCNHCTNVYDTYDELFTHVVDRHPLNQNNQQQATTSEATTEPSDLQIPSATHQSTSTSQLPSAMRPNATQSSSNQPIDKKSNTSNALNRAVEIMQIEPQGSEQFDLLAFLANTRSQIRDYLLSRLSSQRSVKWYLCIQIELERFSVNEDNIRSRPHFRSRTFIVLNQDTYNEHDLNEALQKIVESLEKFMREGSGWVMKQVLHLEVHTVRYSPLNASSYLVLPKTLQNKCSILNIRNFDNSCFEYCILAALHNMNSTNVNDYMRYRGELNLHDIPLPVSISHIDRFEKNNLNISVNIFGYEQNEIFPLRITKHTQRQHHVNLLYLKQGVQSHYCLIQNLNRFLHRTKTAKHRYYFCPFCLQGFTTQALLDKHSEYCSENRPQKVELPNPGENILQFKDFEKTLRVPFIVYADFECTNMPINNRNHVSQQQPCAFAYKVVCEDSKYTKPTRTFVGENASRTFLEYLIQEQEEIMSILDNIQPMIFTTQDKIKFESADKCVICNTKFTDSKLANTDSKIAKTNGTIVKHHNHISGEFIGAAHNSCNINCKQNKRFLPVVFHNLRGYDSHLIMQSVGLFKDKNIKCIANNMEKYISFSLGPLRFIDSLQFMNSSLDKLVENLKLNGKQCFKLFQGTSRQRSGKGAIRKRFPLQKPRWEKTKLTIRYLYHETYRFSR